MQGLRSRWGRALYGGLLLTAIGALLWGFWGTQATLYNRINGGEILFNVDRRLALHPWDCIPVYWKVEGIDKVFFDGNAAVGEQTDQYCPSYANEPSPVLYIDFQSNFIQRFSIPIILLTAQWWFWLLVGMFFVWGAFAFGPPLPTQPEAGNVKGLTRREMLVGLGGIVLVGFMGSVGWALNQIKRPVTTDEGWVLDETEVKP